MTTRASKNRTARRDNKWGAADRNRVVRGHVPCAQASAALARPTPPPVAVRRRVLRGFVRETGLVEGRTWVGKERATKWPRRHAIAQAPTSEFGCDCCLFSCTRVSIAGPILRTRFWSRKRDHAADVRRPQMTIPCMTPSSKSTLWTPRIVARGPVFWTTRWSSNRDRFLTQFHYCWAALFVRTSAAWAPRSGSGNLPWGASGLAHQHLRRHAGDCQATLNRPRWRGAGATRAQAEKRALPCSPGQGLARDSRCRHIAPQSLSHGTVPKGEPHVTPLTRTFE